MSAPTVVAVREAQAASLWGEPVRLTWAACPQRAEVHYSYGRSARRPLVAVLFDDRLGAEAWYAARLSEESPSGFMGLGAGEADDWLAGNEGYHCLGGQVLGDRAGDPEGLLAEAADYLLAERGLILPGSLAKAHPFAGSGLGEWRG